MKLISNLHIYSAGAFILCTFFTGTKVFASTQPKVYFQYGLVYDIGCKDLTKDIQVDPTKNDYLTKKNIMLEARDLTDQLQDLWNRTGQQLLERAIKLIGRPYERNEITANTSACEYGSMSAPLVISIRRGLKNIRKSPAPLNNFIESSLHEMLHVYLSSTFDDSKSQILQSKAFLSQPALFKNHLHVFALMHRVFELENRTDLITRARELYVDISKGDYAKAWEEGTNPNLRDKLMEEIRLTPGNSNKNWPFDEKY